MLRRLGIEASMGDVASRIELASKMHCLSEQLKGLAPSGIVKRMVARSWEVYRVANEPVFIRACLLKS
jgi:hypothetical protein